jgi:hypothetical protein
MVTVAEKLRMGAAPEPEATAFMLRRHRSRSTVMGTPRSVLSLDLRLGFDRAGIGPA